MIRWLLWVYNITVQLVQNNSDTSIGKTVNHNIGLYNGTILLLFKCSTLWCNPVMMGIKAE